MAPRSVRAWASERGVIGERRENVTSLRSSRRGRLGGGPSLLRGRLGAAAAAPAGAAQNHRDRVHAAPEQVARKAEDIAAETHDDVIGGVRRKGDSTEAEACRNRSRLLRKSV